VCEYVCVSMCVYMSMYVCAEEVGCGWMTYGLLNRCVYGLSCTIYPLVCSNVLCSVVFCSAVLC
jgi:hypothetical protein